MVYEVVFSPTGGTKRAAEILARGLGEGNGEGNFIDITTRDFSGRSFGAEDVVIIAVPSYGGRTPAAAVERVQQLKGNAAAAVLLCVYGNRAYEDTLVELADTAEAAGFRIVAAVAAVAEHSILRQYAAGRPDRVDEAVLQNFAARISERLKAPAFTAPVIPGNRPYKKAAGASLVPRAGKNCTACGMCAAACPVGAIPLEKPGTTDACTCISCMRCLSLCPRSARKVNSVMLSAASLALKKVCSQRKECQLFL